jgi:serine/threonine protein kinase
VVSMSPIWVKIGDFGLAKPARDGTVFRARAFTMSYVAPEAGVVTSGDTSEFTNAVDIWALGCITPEMLTTPSLSGIRWS